MKSVIKNRILVEELPWLSVAAYRKAGVGQEAVTWGVSPYYAVL
jgi:hypothetical protein